jgi:hypothetical protein
LNADALSKEMRAFFRRLCEDAPDLLTKRADALALQSFKLVLSGISFSHRVSVPEPEVRRDPAAGPPRAYS